MGYKATFALIIELKFRCFFAIFKLVDFENNENFHLKLLAKYFRQPLNVKLQTIQEFESHLSVCDNILSKIEEGPERSEALPQSIFKQAFEGKLLSEEELEACRKEPDWDPGEKLLERVKNQKEVMA